MSRLTDLIAVPTDTNPGLNGTSNSLMLALLGNPRSSYSSQCQGPTNRAFRARTVSRVSVGPFKVNGFDLAVESLKEVMADIRLEERDIFDALSTAGMLCCRFVRGSTSNISNHSWGTAVDLKIEGVLDRRGNDKVQVGLARIAPIFNRHGWFWGAAFTIEDGMHFEVSKQKMTEWQQQGLLLEGRTPPTRPAIRFGDRGEQVALLQRALNARGERLVADGIFGPATQAAVIDFQSRSGLEPDGIVGRRTRRALGLTA